MSGTVMKFGPQWIRTLTDGAAPGSASTTTTSNSTTNQFNSDNNSNNNPLYSNNSAAQSTNHGGISSSSSSSSNNNNNSGAGKYKLAEYRYGREEMLALYEPGMEAPEDIKMFPELYVEKARMPMAMTQMSEEEVKLSTKGWNSDAVLRSSSKMAATAAAAAAAAGGGGVAGASGPNHVGGVMLGGINSTMSDRDTRQLSERGTLTAAEVLSSSPRGPPGSLSRVSLGESRGGLLSSLSSRGHPSTLTRTLANRNQGLYMRTQSIDDESVGNEGAGGAAQATVGGGLGGGGSTGAFDNRFGSVNQTKPPNSLRARFETNRPPGSVPAGLTSGTKPIDIKSRIDGGENAYERRSVFDRSPNKYNTDDKLARKDINGRPLQSDWRSREWTTPGQEGVRGPPKGSGPQGDERPWRATRAGGAGTAEDWRSGSNPNPSSATSSWYVKTDDPRNPRAPQNQENLNPSFGGKRDTLRRPSADDKQGDEDDDSTGIQPRHRRDSLPEWSIGDPLSGDKVGSFDASGAFREISRDDGGNLMNNIKVKAPEKQSHHQQQHRQQMIQSKRQLDQQNEQQLQGHDFDHLERAAEIMVEKWTEEEEQHDRRSSPDFLGNKSNQTNAREQHDAQQAGMLQNNAIESRKSNQTHQRRESHQSGQESHASVGGGMIASQAFDSTNNPQKFILLPANHEDSQQWFYRDTQGVIQGPFSANDMCEWYKAGYFVKELLVRRACDELFYPLGEIIKMWERIPFAPMPMNLPNPPPITTQTILQFRAVTKQLEMQGRIPQTAFDVGHPGAVLLHGPMLQQQQQQIHPVLAAASLNQNALAPPDQQANIRQIIEAATRQQQQQHQQHQQHQQQHDSSIGQQQRTIPVNVSDQNEMQAQLRQLLAQLKSREGFSNLNAQEQQEMLVRQFVASRSIPQGNVANSNGNMLQDQQEQQAILQQRARMMPFLPAFLSTDQQDRIRYQQEIELRQKEEVEKQQQQSRLIMEQRMKVEEEKQRLMEEVQKQRQRKQNEENEKQKQEAEKERLSKLSQLKQQQLAKQHEEFKQQMQNQQRLQQQQQEKKQQDQHQKAITSPLEQIERAKKAAQAHQLQQEQQQQQQQQQRKTAWSTVSKAEQEPVSLATLQKLQEEEKERERERQRQQQQQQQQQLAQSNQQQLQNFQRQLTWASAAQQSKAAPIKTLAEIQKEEEERLAREKQRKAKAQPVVASSGVWNNAASHLSWKNPPSD